MDKERKLPIYTIAGTEFIVDVEKEELRQADKPGNNISFDEMDYRTSHYYFHYDAGFKNLPVSLSATYEMIQVPNMTELDPLGMAQKYGMEPGQIAGKTDVDIVNDPEQIKMRETGKQPVLEIAGHPFFVDIHWGLLRPKDDFSTLGISFDEIDSYLSDDGNNYRITYDPKAHAFKELEYGTIKSIPKDIIVVEIPAQQKLDPIGFARKYNLNKDSVLRYNPLQMNMQARILPWNETGIKQVIANNLKKDGALRNRQKRGKGI